MATLTVAGVRGLLYRRVGEYAALADMDDSMARAARLAGLSTSSTTRVIDADLSSLVVADHDEFLDVAELRTWESILGNATDMGLRDVAIEDSVATVRETASEKIKSLGAYLKSVYGIGLSTLSVGTVGLNFAAGADSDDAVEEW